MKVLNRAGRATLIAMEGEIDVAQASEGEFSSQLAELYPRWSEFAAWAARFGTADIDMDRLADPAYSVDLGPVSPTPRQVFAIGLNYVDHAAESGFQVPTYPIVFTKFPSAIAGPFEPLTLSGETVDWEVELAVVVGAGGRNISADQAWAHIAGLAVAQDYSDRDAQFRGHPAQFSLGKSFAGFAPIGPVLVGVDEFLAQDEPMIECEIDSEIVQSAPISDMVFSIPDLVQKLSAIVELLPGDVLLTGTPPGVGFGARPPRYLRAGQRVRSRVTGLGYMEQVCVEPASFTN